MKICVCLKQVQSSAAPILIDKNTLWVSEGDSRFETNEADSYALEQALRLKDSINAEVVVLSLGPHRVVQTIKEALAKGADRAMHILAQEKDHLLDPLQLAGSIATAIGMDAFDLILTGLQSNDQGFGQTAGLLAQRLKLPHVSIVLELTLHENGIQVKREWEAGWFQYLQLSLPCVLSIQSGSDKPRYASMKGILAAKKKPIQQLPVAEIFPADVMPSQTMRSLYFPVQSKQMQRIEGAGEWAASELLDKLGLP